MVQVFYGPVLFVIKLSLFLLYLRVFAPARWLRYLVYFGIIFNFLFYASNATIQSIYCTPYPGSTWNAFILSQLEHTNRCDQIITLSLVQSSVNIVSDVYMLILPIPAVWQLRLQTRQKMGVLSIFATGLL
jgi:large subunit ribosomal protein L36e